MLIISGMFKLKKRFLNIAQLFLKIASLALTKIAFFFFF